MIRLLGEGSFGKVWLCSKKAVDSTEDERFAVKVVTSTRSQSWEQVCPYLNPANFDHPLRQRPKCLRLREVRSLQKLGKHPNIVCLRQVIRSKTKANQLNLVFDYHPSNLHVELKSAIRSRSRFSKDRQLRWAFQLLSAVSHAHKNGTIYPAESSTCLYGNPLLS